jgi:hypothetical protein
MLRTGLPIDWTRAMGPSAGATAYNGARSRGRAMRSCIAKAASSSYRIATPSRRINPGVTSAKGVPKLATRNDVADARTLGPSKLIVPSNAGLADIRLG